MTWIDSLLDQGFVPAGMTPKVIDSPGAEAQSVSNDPLSRMARQVSRLLTQQQLDAEKRQEKIKKRYDMFKTLRDAGYDSKTAYDAVIKDEMPASYPAQTEEEKLKIDKTKAETRKITAEAEKIEKGVDPAIEKEIMRIEEKAAEKGYVISLDANMTSQEKLKTARALYARQAGEAMKKTAKGKTSRDRILNKIESGEALTPGEQKIYDEIIKPGGGAASDLDNYTAGQAGGGEAAGGPTPAKVEAMIKKYMTKYPTKSREQIIQQMKIQGLIR